MDSDKIGAYRASVKEGEKDLRQLVLNQIGSYCGQSKRTKLILLGYSQGAQVTGNVYQGLKPGQQGQISAIALWGDPNYNPDDFLADQDNLTLDGSFGSRPLYPHGEARVFSYCNKHDPICQWRLSLQVLLYDRMKEHSLYWKSDEAKNDGSAVASSLVKNH